MAVGLYVTSQEELTNCLAVASQFARGFNGDLIVFVPGREDCVLARAIRTRLKARDGDDNKNPRVRLRPLGDTDAEAALLVEAKPLEKLLLPFNAERAADLDALAEETACTTIRLWCDERNGAWNRVNVLRDGYRHGSARRAAQRMSEQLPKCELRLHPYEPDYTSDDLVLIGTPGDGSRTAEDVAEATTVRTETESYPAVGLVLTGHSFSRRVYAAFENFVQRIVPQMERNRRIKLTNELHVFVTREEKEKKAGQVGQTLKDERFDFLAMIGASAALASLGLVQDSAAVIIGAMLVAPLMSPILAGSLAVVQSHRTLFKRSWQMIALGFLLVFAVSFGVGLVYPQVARVGITNEMASRCQPNLMDFLIAFAGGGAAAYARTRSQLSSALAGAAIAAALVPPIATGGLHFAFELTNNLAPMEGVKPPAHPIMAPLLLFVINVVSIMVAAALSLWASGIRYVEKRGNRTWQLVTVTLLVTLAVTSVLVAHAINVAEQA